MNPHETISLFLDGEQATLDIGTKLAKLLKAPLIVHLLGDLGAGKTTLARGILNGLGHGGAVKSPTYAIVESYPLQGMDVHHFDLYRFSTPEEWEDAGLDDLFGADSVCLIEWPDKGGDFTPEPDLCIALTASDGKREFLMAARTDAGQKIVEAWQN